MVAHLMAQIFSQETQEVFSENIFCRHTTRPWGRRRGPVSKNDKHDESGRKGKTVGLSQLVAFILDPAVCD